MGIEESPVAVDRQITIKGINNPAYLVIVGFSTRGVLDSAKRYNTAFGRPKNIEHVLIIEPDMGKFHALIKREYIGDIVSDPDIDLILGVPAEELLPNVQKVMTTQEGKNIVAMAMKPEMIVDPFSYPFSKDGQAHPEAQRIMGQVQYASTQLTLSMGCSSDSFNRWEQLVPNEKNIIDGFRIKPLFNKFKDVPAIVLGAGPSLQTFIDAYKKYELFDKAIIIAADAALKLLSQNGIKPHIITRCERKYTKIFHNLTPEDTKDVYFAGYPWVDHKFFDLFEKKFMLYRSNGVCKWTGFDPGFVDGGVSAANAALEVAYRLGCEEIILSGIDLCFIGERSHIPGTEVEFDIDRSKDKWTKIAGNAGKDVTSIPVWIRCLGEYQNAIFKHGTAFKITNTSLEGARIEGTTVKPWSEVAPMLKRKWFLKEKLEKLADKHTPDFVTKYKAKKEQTVEELKKLSRDIHFLFADIADSFAIARGEEEKALKQMGTAPDPERYWLNIGNLLPSLTKVYELPASQIDAFKQKWYPTEIFNQTIADICQLDLFQNENKCASLKNITDWNHIRLRLYVETHLNFYQVGLYYINKLIQVLS